MKALKREWNVTTCQFEVLWEFLRITPLLIPGIVIMGCLEAKRRGERVTIWQIPDILLFSILGYIALGIIVALVVVAMPIIIVLTRGESRFDRTVS